MILDLDFEQPLADLAKRLSVLQEQGEAPEQAASAASELQARIGDLYARLSPWQRLQVARHPLRPHTADFVRRLCTQFVELHGDRHYGDDGAILAGVARMGDQTVVVIGNQKGRDTKERQERNFGMAHPEGYRKALRLLAHAERFGFTVLTFIDTPGAYPGLDAEERGISQAIAANLYCMAGLRVPIIATVIGEGGSGGALGIALADRVLMLEHSVYMVAASEAAASILWKDSTQAPKAAASMKITANDLLHLGLVDEVAPEPVGGAHHDYDAAANMLGQVIRRNLAQLQALTPDELLAQRYRRWRTNTQRAIMECEESPRD